MNPAKSLSSVLCLTLVIGLTGCKSAPYVKDRVPPPPAVAPADAAPLSVGVLLFDYDPESVSITAAEAQQQAMAAQTQSTQPASAQPSPGEPQVLQDPGRVHESIRRAESYYLAELLKNRIAESPYFSDVKVVPDETEHFDLIVATRVVRSNGHDVELLVTVTDSRQEVWLEREQFRTRPIASSSFILQKDAQGNDQMDTDPYAFVFDVITKEIEGATPASPEAFDQITQVTTLRYASDMSPAAFPQERYILAGKQTPGASLSPGSLPSDADPNFQRIRQVRANEQQALERFAAYYSGGHDTVQMPYFYWRRDNREAVEYYNDVKKEISDAKMLATAQFGLKAILAIFLGDNTEEKAVIAAAILIEMVDIGEDGRITLDPGNLDENFRRVFQAAKEKEKLVEATAERMTDLGNAFATYVEPITVQIGERTLTFSGKVDEQFTQVRGLLREIYAKETGFDVPEDAPAEAFNSPVVPRVAHARAINNGS
ncbi:MAG: hypothetical protein AAF797_11000 [Planctomycetota bacterium]